MADKKTTLHNFLDHENQDGEVKQTLYCSFCGKSQHEVRLLIAGPTVFICDECGELCEDIFWEQTNDGRIRCKFEVEASETLNQQYYYEAMVEIISEKFPEKEIKLEFLRSPTATANRPNYLSISFNNEIKNRINPGAENLDVATFNKNVPNDIEDTALRLSVFTKKYLFENERNKRIEKEMQVLKEEYLEVLRAKAGVGQSTRSELKIALFLDIVGFSKMESEERVAVVDMLRGIIPPLIGEIGGHEINMWGDAIVATFENSNHAITCAIKFIRHLMVEQLDARIGMAWGEIRTAYNPATDKLDIDGKTVDFAARLESMAEIGGILLSEDFGAMDIDREVARLIPVERSVKKDFDRYKVGDKLKLFEVEILKN